MALVTGLVYVVFYILMVAAPGAFEFLWNAQFMGADMAALVSGVSFGTFLGVLITMLVMGWIMGWLIAHFYNKFTR